MTEHRRAPRYTVTSGRPGELATSVRHYVTLAAAQRYAHESAAKGYAVQLWGSESSEPQTLIDEYNVIPRNVWVVERHTATGGRIRKHFATEKAARRAFVRLAPDAGRLLCNDKTMASTGIVADASAYVLNWTPVEGEQERTATYYSEKLAVAVLRQLYRKGANVELRENGELHTSCFFAAQDDIDAHDRAVAQHAQRQAKGGEA